MLEFIPIKHGGGVIVDSKPQQKFERPDNCILWGERSDLENFYGSMDLHLFTSKPLNSGDSESMPVVLRESVQSWGMKTICYENSRYDGIYDNNSLVTYLSDDFDTNCDIIREVLGG